MKRNPALTWVIFIFAASLLLIILYTAGLSGNGDNNSILRDKAVIWKHVKLRNMESILQGNMNNQDIMNSLINPNQVEWDNEMNDSKLDKITNSRNQSYYMKSPYFNFSSNFDSNVNPDGNRIESVQAYKVLEEFEGIDEVPLKDIALAKVPNTVYYVWCPNKTLEFRQFLGILSIWKIMRPNIIEFRHQYPLVQDNYNNWIDELKEIIPEFVTEQFTSVYDKGELGS